MAASGGKRFRRAAAGRRRRLLPAAAVRAVKMGARLYQPARPAAVHVLSSPLGDRSGPAARARELAVALAALYELGQMRGAFAAAARRVRVRPREGEPRAARAARVMRSAAHEY